MTKRNKTVLIALPLLILAGVAVFLLCTNQENFTDSGVYTAVVEARHAKGTIHISAGDDE